MTLDPNEHTIPELGPKIKDIEDLSELEEILQKEHRGENRQGAIALIQSRIDKFSEDEEEDDGEIDLAGMSVADVGNAVRDVEEVPELEALLEQEESGEDRDSVKRLIRSRIDSVQGSDEDESEDAEAEEEEPQTPEERHPDLSHPTADKQHVRALDGGRYEDMWVFCETQQGELIDVSKEMLAKARELMDTYNDDYDADEKVVAVVIGEDVEGLAEETIAYGADVAVYTDDPALSRFRLKPFTEVFCDMARGAGHEFGREDRPDEPWHDYDEPRYTVFPATNNGRDLSATVQAELDSGLASDC